MKLAPKIAGTAVAVLAFAGTGIAGAVASSAATRAPVATRAAHAEPVSPDNDAVQQGDQSGPDNAAAAAHRAIRAHSDRADNPGETASAENGASDGAGGHADSTGNVQHEFNGAE